jgi:arylsulfatase A-like enzyme
LSAQLPIRNLQQPGGISADEESATRDFLGMLNARHAEANPGNSELQARVAAYQLAAKMQLSAPEVTDLAAEPESTHKLYGTDDANPLKAAYARNCLLARRLLERGVRYVNLYCASRASGVDGLLNWDAHKTLKSDYERHCPIFDQPTAALLTDLKQRGLLEDTLVLWTTEFGRMPTHQDGTTGRDHNPDGFTCWMMGAGIRGGTSYGATDEFGRKSVDNPVTVWDFYATVLQLLGFDHKRLTWYYNGLDRRLTDVQGRVIADILA